VGKTLLLSQWAERNHQAFASVSVDEKDNDPKILLSYVARALDTVQARKTLTAGKPLSKAVQAPNWPFCVSRQQRASHRPARQSRRSDFLSKRPKRLRTIADKVQRTVSEYARLCIKRACPTLAHRHVR
jgi:hypothetical protein